MALSKERKKEVVSQYETWLSNCRAVFLTEYTGLDVSAVDELREKVREAGGEFHIIKNSLGKLAFASTGLEIPDEYWIGSTALGVAYEDPPGTAKAIADFAKEYEVVKIKGGFLGKEHMAAAEVMALAELPPLPVVQSQIIALLNAPANKIARLLAEPGRQLAQLLSAKSEGEPAAA